MKKIILMTCLSIKIFADSNEDNLFFAVKNNDIDLVKNAIEQGADINAQDNKGKTALMIAVNSNSISPFIEFILSKKDGPFIYKQDQPSLMIIEFLIHKGADINAQDNEGKTALIIALEQKNIPIAQLLINNGADIDAQNQDGYTALMIALENDYLSIAQFLIDNGANINAQDNNGTTTLMFAAKSNNLRIVEFLVNNGADINTKNDFSDTALLIAAERDFISIVEFLINNDADINAKDGSGYTALMLANQNNHFQIARFLQNFVQQKLAWKKFTKIKETIPHISEYNEQSNNSLDNQAAFDKAIAQFNNDLEAYFRPRLQEYYKQAFINQDDLKPEYLTTFIIENINYLPLIKTYFSSAESFRWVIKQLSYNAASDQKEILDAIVEEEDKIAWKDQLKGMTTLFE